MTPVKPTVEELMKPRYKVINTWPDMANVKFVFGDIITLQNYDGKQWYIQDRAGKRYDAYFDGFPHLFRRLEWWEERDVKDMPHFLKHKTEGWSMNVKGYRLYELSGWAVTDKETDDEHFLSDFIPITEQDYTTQTPNQ